MEKVSSRDVVYMDTTMPNNEDITVVSQVESNHERHAIQIIMNGWMIKKVKFLEKMFWLQAIVVALLVIKGL